MLAKLITDYLDATDTSRRRLAHTLDVSNHTVGQWCNGGPVGDDEVLVRLLDVIEAPPYARRFVWGERWGLEGDLDEKLGNVIGVVTGDPRASVA